jgi:hypothetical protein
LVSFVFARVRYSFIQFVVCEGFVCIHRHRVSLCAARLGCCWCCGRCVDEEGGARADTRTAIKQTYNTRERGAGRGKKLK